MAYTYPDKNDLLTCQLIDTEFDGAYWAESEAEVLRQALEETDAVVKLCREKKKAVSLLDLGCGMGRLFPVFAAKADLITAAEPDEERFAAAEAAASGKRYGRACKSCATEKISAGYVH